MTAPATPDRVTVEVHLPRAAPCPGMAATSARG